MRERLSVYSVSYISQHVRLDCQQQHRAKINRIPGTYCTTAAVVHQKVTSESVQWTIKSPVHSLFVPRMSLFVYGRRYHLRLTEQSSVSVFVAFAVESTRPPIPTTGDSKKKKNAESRGHNINRGLFSRFGLTQLSSRQPRHEEYKTRVVTHWYIDTYTAIHTNVRGSDVMSLWNWTLWVSLVLEGCAFLYATAQVIWTWYDGNRAVV